jgi:hypothetical protein
MSPSGRVSPASELFVIDPTIVALGHHGKAIEF